MNTDQYCIQGLYVPGIFSFNSILLTQSKKRSNMVLMAVTVEITPEAREQAARLNEPLRSRILAIIERLGNWPRVSGAKPLRGNLAGRYRIRTGDYRVQFHLRGNVLIVEKIGHRDGFYED